jgi:hypothetical protein
MECNVKCRYLKNWPVPEIIEPVFAETSPKGLFCMTENERFGLVFVKTGSLNSGTVKGLSDRCFICLRPPPLLWPHTPLTHCIHVYSILTHTGKGGGRANQRKGYSGNSSQSRSKIPTWLTVSPLFSSLWTLLNTVKTTFRVWCVYN